MLENDEQMPRFRSRRGFRWLFLISVRRSDSHKLTVYLLLVTLCKPGEFQCKDGSCISNFSRCDQVVNCEDASDEMNCREQLLTYRVYEGKAGWRENA